MRRRSSYGTLALLGMLFLGGAPAVQATVSKTPVSTSVTMYGNRTYVCKGHVSWQWGNQALSVIDFLNHYNSSCNEGLGCSNYQTVLAIKQVAGPVGGDPCPGIDAELQNASNVRLQYCPYGGDNVAICPNALNTWYAWHPEPAFAFYDTAPSMNPITFHVWVGMYEDADPPHRIWMGVPATSVVTPNF